MLRAYGVSLALILLLTVLVPVSGGHPVAPSHPSPVPPASGTAGPARPADTCPVSTLGVAGPTSDQARTAGSAGVGGFSAHSVDPAAVPNTGFQYNATGFALPNPPSNGNGTFEVDEQETIADQVLVMGFIAISNFTGPDPVPFWAVVANTTDKVLQCGYLDAAPTVGAVVPFVAQNIGGRTWEVTYRGVAFDGSNNITMNGSFATWTGGIGLVAIGSWTNAPWAPADVLVPSSMRVFTSSGWYLPHPVVASWNGSVPAPWGEEGTAQVPYLAPGELELGTDVPVVANGTALWTSSAPTPVSVDLELGSVNLPGGTSTEIVLNESSDGHPIPGLLVTWGSSAGGTFAPSAPWTTNSVGVAIGNFTAPLVSVATTSNLTATVGNGLYQGFGSAQVNIAPTSLSLQVGLSRTRLGVGGLVNVTLRAVLGTSGVAGVNVTVSASVGGGVFTPYGPWITSSGGYENATYQVPGTAGPVELFFTVARTGYSGSAVAWLNVTTSTVQASGGGMSLLYAGATVAGLVVVGVLVLLASRRRRPTAEEDEPEPGDVVAEPAATATPEETPQGEDPEGDEPTTSARCPGCGKEVAPDEGRFCRACGSPLALSERRKAIGPAT